MGRGRGSYLRQYVELHLTDKAIEEAGDNISTVDTICLTSNAALVLLFLEGDGRAASENWSSVQMLALH